MNSNDISSNPIQPRHGDPGSNPPRNDRKTVHRDGERQRRRDMSMLYTSLQLLLPPEFVKGKRSICDHMNDAFNYINHLKEKIQELRSKRDRLKRSSDLAEAEKLAGSVGASGSNYARIQRRWQGVEVVVCSSLEADEMVPLSSVLRVMYEQGWSVVSCVSSKFNERIIHTIQAEVMDQDTNNDINGLQQKLMTLFLSKSPVGS